MSDPTIEILNAPPGHYRWKCSCGSMGIRLCYKESVQALAVTHLQIRHNIPPKPPTKDQQIALMEAEIKRLHIVIAEWAAILRFFNHVTINDVRRAIGLEELQCSGDIDAPEKIVNRV